MVFEQSLSGLIKALRASKSSEEAVIKSALNDIAIEVRSPEWDLKAGAILKLTYLEMLGHSHLAQHSFQVIECMACPKLHVKQIGYLAASQSFVEHTETILLTNNLIKKDLSTAAANPSALLLTLSSLPPLLNTSPQLVDDLDIELQRQLTHSRAQVRSSAVLVLGSVWKSTYSQNTDVAESIINKLADRLVDTDQSVICSAVNVMLELARHCQTDDQRVPFLRLAPECFELLTTSSNNWMLIKIIKLFAILTPVEPRLVRKLLPPLTHLISTTPAMSLLYECIHAVIVGGMLHDNEGLAKTCVNKLSAFLSDADQNLRYIALLALSKLLPSHPHLIVPYSNTILNCIDDHDTSIRARALDLLEGMADRSNLQVIIKRLMSHLNPSTLPSAQAALSQLATGSSAQPSLANPEYKANLIERILKITSSSSYANIANFNWYIDLFGQLARIAVSLPSTSTSVDNALEKQIETVFIDVCARVRAIRPYAVTQCLSVLFPEGLLPNASAWIVGEFANNSIDWQAAILILQEADCGYAALKVLARWSSHLVEQELYSNAESMNEFKKAVKSLQENSGISKLTEYKLLLDVVLAHSDFKPKPTSSFSAEEEDSFGNSRPDEPDVPYGLTLLPSIIFPYELNPVNERAQSLVGVPEGLDLQSWINPGSIPPLPTYEQQYDDTLDEFGRPRGGFGVDAPIMPTEALAKPRKKKDRGITTDGKTKKKKSKRRHDAESEDIDAIPIVKLDLGDLRPVKEERSPTPPPLFVDVDGELPPAATPVKEETKPLIAPAKLDEKVEALLDPEPVPVVKKVKKVKRPKQ